MAIRNIVLTVLSVIFSLHLIIAQTSSSTDISSERWNTSESTTIEWNTSESTTIESSTSESTTIESSTSEPITISTTTSNPVSKAPCPDGGLPLFSDDNCISRSAYTGIFLSSIILAGLSFIILIGLLISLYCRRSRSSKSDYSSDEDGSSSSNSVVDAIPLDRRPNQNMAAKPRDKQATSTAPYSNATPVLQEQTTASTRRNHGKPSDSHNVTPKAASQRPNNNPRVQPSSQPARAARRTGHSAKSRTNNYSTDDDLTSQF